MGKLESLQILRALAAVMVVLHHSIRSFTVFRPDYVAGLPDSVLATEWFRESLASGVDIFFVISGFIMVYGADRYSGGKYSPWSFLLKRIRRIYPPYLIVTAIIVANSLRDGTAWASLSAYRIFASMLLLPAFDQNGHIAPILGVGWTLSYEMYFYIMFAAALLFAGRRYVAALSVGIALIWATASYISSQTAVGQFFANPIVFEFLFGCAVGLAAKTFKLSGWLALAAIPAYLMIFAFYDAGLTEKYRLILWGIPAALTVLGIVSWRHIGNGYLAKAGVFLGNASYAIYLTHPITLYILMPRVLSRLAKHGALVAIEEAVLLSVAASVVVGSTFYIFVEKRLMEPKKIPPPLPIELK